MMMKSEWRIHRELSKFSTLQKKFLFKHFEQLETNGLVLSFRDTFPEILYLFRGYYDLIGSCRVDKKPKDNWFDGSNIRKPFLSIGFLLNSWIHKIHQVNMFKQVKSPRVFFLEDCPKESFVFFGFFCFVLLRSIHAYSTCSLCFLVFC